MPQFGTSPFWDSKFVYTAGDSIQRKRENLRDFMLRMSGTVVTPWFDPERTLYQQEKKYVTDQYLPDGHERKVYEYRTDDAGSRMGDDEKYTKGDIFWSEYDFNGQQFGLEQSSNWDYKHHHRSQ